MRLIDADAFKQRNERLLKCDFPYISEETLEELIDDAPTIEEPKKGKWIESNDTIIRGTCSCCGWNAITAETDVVGMPFCPNCGAAMDGHEAAKKLCPRCHSLYLQASTQCPACGWLEHYPKY